MTQALSTPCAADTRDRTRLVVGVSDLKVSNNRQASLITYALGSCIGVTLYDPVAGVGGMLHYMLPLASRDPDKAQNNPAMYGDTGFVMLLNQVLDQGAQKERLVVKVAGGGAPMDAAGWFKIGQRNLAVLRKLLWKNRLLIAAEDTGGTRPRTMRLQLADGQVTVSSGKETSQL